MAGDFYDRVLDTLKKLGFLPEKINLANMEIAEAIGGRISIVRALLDGIVIAHKREIRDPSLNTV